MRELEFLPAWYHQTRGHKRIVLIQTWTLVLLVVGLSTWTLLARRSIRAAEASLVTLSGRLEQTQTEQKVLEQHLSLKQQLESRRRLIASLGFPVETTRLLQTLDGLMPPEMSLLDFSCETVEQPRQTSGVLGARYIVPPAGEQQSGALRQMDRRLNVKLVGVAPSDLDLASFLAGLSGVPFFEQVAVTYARDKLDAGHILREFEVTFSIDLNQRL
jgi:Tfp pilus assembly protein PilN